MFKKILICLLTMTVGLLGACKPMQQEPQKDTLPETVSITLPELEKNHPDLYREMPQNELHLVASCKIKRGQERFLSAAPKGIVLENLNQRMSWIADAADLYKRKMNDSVDKQFLEEQLRILANGKKADGTEHA